MLYNIVRIKEHIIGIAIRKLIISGFVSLGIKLSLKSHWDVCEFTYLIVLKNGMHIYEEEKRLLETLLEYEEEFSYVKIHDVAMTTDITPFGV